MYLVLNAYHFAEFLSITVDESRIYFLNNLQQVYLLSPNHHDLHLFVYQE